MRISWLTIGLLWVSAAGVAAQEPGTGAAASATLSVRVQVVPGPGVAFGRVAETPSAGAQADAAGITLEAQEPRELMIEVWEGTTGKPPAAGERRLVAAAPVRLRRDASGRVRERLPGGIAGALESAARAEGGCQVVVVY